jgi:hypothetical protein
MYIYHTNNKMTTNIVINDKIESFCNNEISNITKYEEFYNYIINKYNLTSGYDIYNEFSKNLVNYKLNSEDLKTNNFWVFHYKNNDMIYMNNLTTLNNDLFTLPNNTTYAQFKNMANNCKKIYIYVNNNQFKELNDNDIISKLNKKLFYKNCN